MSKISEYRALEAQIAEQLKQLDTLKNNEALKREIEFEEKLRRLMVDYNVNLRGVIAILDPQVQGRAERQERGLRRQRQIKVYKNPETGEVIETKGGNHKVLKTWKEKYGAEKVESWQQ